MTVMLYKHPGPHEIHGDKFDYTIVDEADVDSAVKDGWALTTDAAKNGTAEAPRRGRKPKAEE
jgi:hypothetical protein